ncbi:MAG TPA: hypothetical protein DIW31_01815 [Bacteroidales bacterium]|nr:hypothetical protein [Bacteroidales bacterium]
MKSFKELKDAYGLSKSEQKNIVGGDATNPCKRQWCGGGLDYCLAGCNCPGDKNLNTKLSCTFYVPGY